LTAGIAAHLASLLIHEVTFQRFNGCRRTRAMRRQFSNHKLNKSRGSEVERLVTFLTIMKKILFALSMLAFVVSALPQATRADVSIDFFYNNLSGGNWIEVEGYGDRKSTRLNSSHT